MIDADNNGEFVYAEDAQKEIDKWKAAIKEAEEDCDEKSTKYSGKIARASYYNGWDGAITFLKNRLSDSAEKKID